MQSHQKGAFKDNLKQTGRLKLQEIEPISLTKPIKEK